MSNTEQAAPLALVTGAAVRLGRAFALALAARGYAIGLHYHRSQPAAEVLAKEISAQGGRAALLQADLTAPEQITALFEKVDALAHPLRVLVNSAAVMEPGRLSAATVEQWDSTLNLNLRAAWLCARAAAARMASGGVILNITDTGANKAWTGYGAYVVSKAGLEALTRLLAREFAPAVRVNAIAPGLILPAPGVQEDAWQRLVQSTPLQQAGSPEQVAQAALFLIEHPYITGHTLVVDGGYQLK